MIYSIIYHLAFYCNLLYVLASISASIIGTAEHTIFRFKPFFFEFFRHHRQWNHSLLWKQTKLIPQQLQSFFIFSYQRYRPLQFYTIFCQNRICYYQSLEQSYFPGIQLVHNKCSSSFHDKSVGNAKFSFKSVSRNQPCFAGRLLLGALDNNFTTSSSRSSDSFPCEKPKQIPARLNFLLTSFDITEVLY